MNMRQLVLSTVAGVIVSALLLTPVKAQEALLTEEPTSESTGLTHRSQYPVNSLTSLQQLRLDGFNPFLELGLGSRADRLVDSATLTLNYRFSPAILGDVSQVNILLNSETVKTITLENRNADSVQSAEIDLSAPLFTDYNRITFELIAQSTSEQCRAPSGSTWFEILSGSQINVSYLQLPVTSELAYFPEPFFYQSDFSNIDIPFFLPEQQSTELLTSAGILASYFASETQWRVLDITPKRYQQKRSASERLLTPWGKQHAVVFMTNDQRPAAFTQLPTITQPRVEMLEHPVYSELKVLAIMAPDDAGLVDAAQALAAAAGSLSGSYATFNQFDAKPREPYLAPNWVSTQREVKFSELVNDASELQRKGFKSAPISLALRLPPDLFIWQKSGVPLDLEYRYTPPIMTDDSRLLVSINNEFVKSFKLDKSGAASGDGELRVPIIDTPLLRGNNLELPAFKLGVINQIQFDFEFSQVGSACNLQPANSSVGAIDGSSSIDLVGFDHYAQLPDLQLFAKAGYPFSRYDDLSNTLVVLDEQPSHELLSLFLANMVKMSASTGFPVFNLNVTHVSDIETTASQDILVLGQSATQQFLKRFGDKNLTAQLLGHKLARQAQLFSNPNAVLNNSGPLAALVAFQSPLNSSASVIMQTATSDEHLKMLRERLLSPSDSNQFHGFLSLVSVAGIAHYAATQQYFIGDLSFWNQVKYHTAQHPIILVLVVLFAILVVALGLYRWLRSNAKRKQGE
tara:strand:- start:2784 stop:5018 length:2235 start_codon:yes stop_codon:yes gene_type:complete